MCVAGNKIKYSNDIRNFSAVRFNNIYYTKTGKPSNGTFTFAFQNSATFMTDVKRVKSSIVI